MFISLIANLCIFINCINYEIIGGQEFLNPHGKSRPTQNLLKLPDNQLEGLIFFFFFQTKIVWPDQKYFIFPPLIHGQLVMAVTQ